MEPYPDLLRRSQPRVKASLLTAQGAVARKTRPSSLALDRKADDLLRVKSMASLSSGARPRATPTRGVAGATRKMAASETQLVTGVRRRSSSQFYPDTPEIDQDYIMSSSDSD